MGTNGPSVRPVREKVAFSELANGFASCEQPAALQAICDRFGRSDVQAFFDRWTSAIPLPLTADDKNAGYFWELSMRQVEVSRTLVFDDPRPREGLFRGARHRQCRRRPARRGEGRVRPHYRGVRTSLPSQTRVFSPGTEVKIDFTFKHSRVKQYLKEGRALRIETVINKPSDIGVLTVAVLVLIAAGAGVSSLGPQKPPEGQPSEAGFARSGEATACLLSLGTLAFAADAFVVRVPAPAEPTS